MNWIELKKLRNLYKKAEKVIHKTTYILQSGEDNFGVPKKKWNEKRSIKGPWKKLTNFSIYKNKHFNIHFDLSMAKSINPNLI